MASIRPYQAKDGAVTYTVRWRVGGRGSKETSETFTDEATAKVFKSILENQGEDAAYEWLRAQLSDDERASVPTLDEAMDSYIDHLTAADEGTKDEYKRMYRPHWGNATCDATSGRPFGTLPYDAIVYDMASEIVLGDLSQRLKLKSLKNTKGLMSQAFAHWVDDPNSPVTHNPFKRVKLPKHELVDEEDDEDVIMFLTHEEFQLIYDQLPEHWQPLVGTLVGTGARWSEATAVSVGRVRTPENGSGAGRLRIMRAWKRIPGGRTLGKPKTKRGTRWVDLVPDIVRFVHPLTVDRPDDAFLFVTTEGLPVSQSNFYHRVWKPAVWRASVCPEHRKRRCCGREFRRPITCKRHNSPPSEACGCPGTLKRRPRVHDLRHTYVAWMVAQGVQLPAISRQVGHENIQTTWNIYGDLLPELRELNLELGAKAFKGLRLFDGDPARAA